MARERLAVAADEQSTYVVTLTFFDAADEAVQPDSLVWTLTALDGTVINEREDVAATPDESVRIVLSGDDLALQAGEGGSVRRLLTVEATYTSTEGSGLPLKREYEFTLRGLVAVA